MVHSLHMKASLVTWYNTGNNNNNNNNSNNNLMQEAG